MARPTVSPDFATDTNFTAPGKAWDGQPTKVAPGGIKTEGWEPQTPLAAQHINYMIGNHADWINYMQSSEARSFFRESWLAWSSPIAANNAYTANFTLAWTGANPAALQSATATYDTPFVKLADSLQNTEIAAFYCGVGVIVQSSFFTGSFSTDVAMSAIGANNLTIAAGCSVGTSGNFSGALFWKASANTNWQCKTDNGAATTTTDSGVPPVANTFQRLRIDFYGSGVTGGLRTLFYIDGTIVASHTTNITTTASLVPRANVLATANTGSTVNFGTTAMAWSRGSGL